MVLIVIVGIGLVVYSRNESLSGPSASKTGPTATDHWDVALGIDLCGKLQPALPANTNLTQVGIRTFGDGLIDIDPGVVTNSAKFEGAKATLGLFASSYPGFKLTDTSIGVPVAGKKPITFKNGDTCTGPLHGKGTLVAQVWSSPTATPTLITKNITSIHLNNDQMITIAFVPTGAKIPEPSSKSTLISTVAANAKIGNIATTTTTTPVATTPTTTTATTTTGTKTTTSTTATSTS